LFPDTVTADPTSVPPEQSLGALDDGPNTLNVTVPDGDAPPDNSAPNDDAPIATPGVPEEGAEMLNDGLADTTVSAMLPPHADATALLSPSPP
jgi:hypothetical protein